MVLTKKTKVNENGVYQKSEILEITPEIAAEWLSKNKNNRSLNDGRVYDYSERIKSGKWMLNGESIKFDKNNNLLDGQHRLHAVIKAGVSITSLVVFGLDSEVFKTIDGGKMRSGADALHILGYKYASLLSGAIRFIMKIKQKDLSTRVGSVGRYSKVANIDPIDEIMFLKENEHIQNWTIVAEKLSKQGGVSIGLGKTVILGFLYLFSEKDENEAMQFITNLCCGVNLEMGDPIWLLRDRLQKAALSPTMNIPTAVRNALVIKAWNAYRTGNYMKQLKYVKGEKFPEIM